MGNRGCSCSDVVKDLLSLTGFWSTAQKCPSSVVIRGTRYHITNLLGEGGCAFVYSAEDEMSGTIVALKQLIISDEKQRQKALEEVSVQRAVSPHSCIVSLFHSEFIERPGRALPELWLVMEHGESPSLQSYINLRIKTGKPFAVREVYEIITVIVQAIAHLHSQSPPISHWDIKADNFLFTDSQSIKMCDFGSATRLYYEPKDARQIGIAEEELSERMTFLYRSPESLDLWSKKRVDTKCDVWALGVLLYVLLFFEMPFEANALEIMDGIPRRFRPGSKNVVPEEYSPLVGVMMDCMLVKDPSKRSDIFAVSERLSPLTLFPPEKRPLPGLQSAQRSRFE